ncbi:MAG: hypothetical protein CR997_13010 [Acidobacteria bacterium]|nr:MAG: hypothetical protein CR997_13010 [Acidobacteriota bacterium]
MILSLTLLSFILLQEGDSWFVDRVAVKVNDKIINERELMITYKKQKAQLLQEYSGSDLTAEYEKLWNQIMDDAVDQLLLYEKAVELGIDISEETLDANLQNQKESYGLDQAEFEKMLEQQTGMTLQQYIDFTIRFQSGQRVVQREVWGAIIIDDPEVAKYYQEHIDQYTNPEVFQIAEIVFLKGESPEAAREKAQKCLAELKEGFPFSKAVEKYSEAASKAIGGDLGELFIGDLNPTIEKAAQNLEVGAYSKIIELEASYYLIKLLKRTAATPKPIDEVKEEIKMSLREPRFDATFDKYLKGLRNEYLIEKLISKPSQGF